MKRGCGIRDHFGRDALRTHTSAAPLKLKVDAVLDEARDALRTHTSAAPLKRHRLQVQIPKEIPLRTHTSAAPLKQGGCEGEELAL